MKYKGVEELASAVIKQSCMDYFKLITTQFTVKRVYNKDLHRFESDSDYLNRCLIKARVKAHKIRVLRSWFLSDDFNFWSVNIDGKALLQELDRKAKAGEQLHFIGLK